MQFPTYITYSYFTSHSKQVNVCRWVEPFNFHMKLQYYLLNYSNISNFSSNTGKEYVNGNKVERKKDIRVLLDRFCLAVKKQYLQRTGGRHS